MADDERRLRTGVLLTLAYDGRDFHGFAPQPGVRTVAGTLLAAVRSIDPWVDQVRGASRTDAGVHARGQLVAFDTAKTIPPKGWALGVNQALPDDVAVQSASLVSEGFNPRFSNLRKTYLYELHLGALRDPLKHRRAWWVQPPLDLGLLEREASTLVGTHDFAAFRSAADGRDNTIRTLESVAVEVALPRVVIRVTGPGFMHNMVRIIVGTLVDVARKRLPVGAVARALLDGDRRSCGITAPSGGLRLEAIDLDPSVTFEARWPC